MFKFRPVDVPEFKAGDILGFSGHALLSAWINLMTYGIPFWGLSHCGIIAEHQGQLVLFESCAETPDPCIVQEKLVSGSQAHDIDRAVASYPGKVWHYPLYRKLYDFESKRLSKFLRGSLGMPYDTIGAFRATGVGFSTLESMLRPADLSSLFCSEWCCAAHSDIGVFPTDHSGRYSPNRFVRTERRHGILLKPTRLK